MAARAVPVPVAVLAALALSVAGCTSSGSGSRDSSGDFHGEQRQVATVIEHLQSAASNGDQDEVCSTLLAPDVVRRLDAHGGCRKVVDEVLKDADTSDLTVKSVRITGDRAQATVTTDTGDHEKRSTVLLVKQGRLWKISGF